MDSGLYAAYTGLLARTQALDTAANNLANAGANGFRAQRDFFGSVLGSAMGAAPESQVGNSVNRFGVLGGNLLDMGEGQVTPTGNPLDLALQGAGLFAIQTSNGIRYTRDGAFSVSPQGQLQNAKNELVLDQQGQPLTIPSGSIQVAPDGTISVANAQGSAIAGRVGIFAFAPHTILTAEGSSRLAAPAGAVPIAGDAKVQQGAVEGSNQDAVHGTLQLMLVQRQAEMMQKALSVFNNDFDKTAAEELSRV